MYLVKVLKRKDAASVVVAILVAMTVIQLLSSWTGQASTWISGLPKGQFAPPGSWRVLYLMPFVSVVLQLVLLEVLVRAYVLVHALVTKKR